MREAHRTGFTISKFGCVAETLGRMLATWLSKVIVMSYSYEYLKGTCSKRMNDAHNFTQEGIPEAQPYWARKALE